MADYPVIPAYHRSGGWNLPPSRAVVHCTTGPCRPGAARDVGGYFSQPSSGGSAHLGVDPAEIIRYLPDEVIAWHAPPNSNSLGMELCDPMDGDPARWRDPAHVAMLTLGAGAMRRWCDLHAIPITRIETPGLRQGLRGLTGHHDVSQAWGLSDHWDPGPYFPWGTFLGLVAGVIDKEDAMSADTEAAITENWLRLIQQQKRQAAADRALLTTLVPQWYEFYLGRPATVATVESFLRRYDDGTSLSRLEQIVRTSPEARARQKALA